MADALQTILGLKKIDPMLDPSLASNDPYSDMISEQDLYDLQDDYASSPRTMFAVPSRDALRQGATSKLRQVFGLKEADARAKMLPEQIKGEYNLRQEDIKRQTAAENAKRMSEERAMARDFTAGQNALNREALAGRQSERLDAQAMQGDANRMAMTARAQAGNAARVAQKAQPPSALQKFLGMFGMSSAPDNEIVSTAADIANDFPNTSFDELVANGIVSADSDEELQQLRDALVKVRGF